VTEHEKLGD
jgi:chromosome segregation ATPase